MARYSTGGLIGRVVLLLLAIAGLIIGGLVWFNWLGVIHKDDSITFVKEAMGIDKPDPMEGQEDNIYLLDSVRILKEREALNRRSQLLDTREQTIEVKEAEISQISDTLSEKEKSLKDKEKSLNDAQKRYDNKSVRLEESSVNLSGMAPESAVAILKGMKDQDVIDVLRKTDEIALRDGKFSMASRWLSMFDAERAALIQEKMLLKPINKD